MEGEDKSKGGKAPVNVMGHPEGCACGIHLFPTLFEMAEKRKAAKAKEEITKNLPPKQAADEVDRYLKSLP